MPEFDVAGAKAAGYTDEEINAFVAQQGMATPAPQPAAPAAPTAAPVDFDVAGAKAAGYSDEEIAQFTGSLTPQPAKGDLQGMTTAWRELGAAAEKSGDPNAITSDAIRALAQKFGFDAAKVGNADQIAEYWAKNKRWNPDIFEVQPGKPPVGVAAEAPPFEAQNPVLETLSNVPESAANFASDFVQPFLHPIQTATALKDIGAGVLAKAGIGDADEATANAVGEYLANRYGGLENLQATIKKDPVGFLADASLILTAGGSAAARVPGIVGKAGKVAATVGTKIDPLATGARAVRATASGVGALAKPVVSHVLGTTTGAGGRAVREAGRAGYAGGQLGEIFRAHMRGEAPVEDVVNTARQAVENMRLERSAAYQRDIAGTTALPAQPIPFTRIDSVINAVRGRGFFNGRVTDPGAAQAWTRINDVVAEWRAGSPGVDHTPAGLDALKKAVGSIRDDLPFGSPGRNAATEVYNAIKGEIVAASPQYARTMRDYERASTALQELERTFQLGRQAPIDTAMRRLQSIMRNNANTNYGRRAELGERLVDSGADGLNEMLAGQALSSWTPRGIQGGATGVGGLITAGTNPGLLPLFAATSPRLAGETAHALGRGARGVTNALDAVKGAYTPYRSGLANASTIGGRGIDDPDALAILGDKYANDPMAEPRQATPAAAPAGAPPAPTGERIVPKADYGPLPFQSLRQRQIQQESGGKNVVNPKSGAFGPSQLMKHTARDPGYGIAPLRDNSVEENLRLGDEYMAAMLNEYQNQPLALMAYNWGPKRVDIWLKGGMRGRVPDETRNYVNAIMGQNIFPNERRR